MEILIVWKLQKVQLVLTYLDVRTNVYSTLQLFASTCFIRPANVSIDSFLFGEGYSKKELFFFHLPENLEAPKKPKYAISMKKVSVFRLFFRNRQLKFFDRVLNPKFSSQILHCRSRRCQLLYAHALIFFENRWVSTSNCNLLWNIVCGCSLNLTSLVHLHIIIYMYVQFTVLTATPSIIRRKSQNCGNLK